MRDNRIQVRKPSGVSKWHDCDLRSLGCFLTPVTAGAFGGRGGLHSNRKLRLHSPQCLRLQLPWLEGYRMDGFPLGMAYQRGQTLVTKEVCAAIRLITCFTRLSSHNKPQSAHAYFLEPWTTSNVQWIAVHALQEVTCYGSWCYVIWLSCYVVACNGLQFYVVECNGM